jgi:hypothetical protein
MNSIPNLIRTQLAIVCLLLAACASAPVGHKDLLDFLNDGVTRREEVQLKLGLPSAQYEGSRILAYRLSKDAGGYILVERRDNWYGVQYDLMLEFGADGVLRRHSVVEVRSP